MDMFKQVNGINICYDESGDGKPVILVHGLSSSKETMYYLRDVLKDSYKVYSIDCRGHGLSDKMANYTLEDHAKDVIAFAKSLNYDKVNLIGYSMGSYISLRAAELDSDIFDNVILVGTKGDGKTSSVQNLIESKGFKVDEISDKQYTKILAGAVFAPKTSIFTKIKILKYSAKKLNEEEKVAENKALENFDNFKDVSKVTAKTLVIAGEFDKINPPELGLEVANAIPGCKYEVIKDAGHMMLIEKPKDLSKLIKEFIS